MCQQPKEHTEKMYSDKLHVLGPVYIIMVKINKRQQ